ncbi:MAG TPA: tripartite tricarboxylate transporter substrate binding protein [Casimicrobiaceae bacterium]|nr:tripartite tricarboxylate transporter substrate binding protein [Casimicrobiaceae bacterium]
MQHIALMVLAALSAMSLAQAPAHAQPYPSKAIRIIVPHAPGGVTDVITRIVAQPLGDVLGQSIIVENRPGAAGLVGTEVAARAPADGYTLLMYVDANTIFPSTVKQLAHDPEGSFSPITLIARGSHVLVAHPSLPVSTLQHLVQYAKANPGQLSYASPGTGSPQHLAGETIKLATGIDVAHVPYKGGGQAIGDVIGGQVKLGVLGMAPVMPHYKAGKLKILAVTGGQRSTLLPDVPTVAESGVPGFSTLQWTGIVAPAGTPPEIVARVHGALATILKQPAIVEKITSLGQEPSASATPDEFRQMIRAEIKRWPAVVTAAGVKPE